MWRSLFFLTFFVFAFAFGTTAIASDIAFYVGQFNIDGWYGEEQFTDVETIIAETGHLFNDIQQFNDDDLTFAEFNAWVEANTDDGEMDIIWLNGCTPSGLYPNPNELPDGSRIEAWLDGGNMVINVGDWFAYCTYEGGPRGGEGRGGDNGGDGAANILDLSSGIIVGADGTMLTVTPSGQKYLPSLGGATVETDRPVVLSAVQAPWEVAAIFASPGGTEDPAVEAQGDPIVIHNTETGGYVAFINQASGGPDGWINDRGLTCAEFIGNWATNVLGLGAMEIGFAAYPPVIDGELDGIWADASEQYFVPLEDPADGSGTWKVLYDAENLYVLVDMTDDSLQNDSASSWQDDSVEIYFDGGNTKLDTPLSGDDHQYTFGWTTDEIQGTNISGYTDGIEHAQVDTSTGWRIEVKMPWMSIWGVMPQAGDLIGIDCYYNDDDDGGDSREGKMLSFSVVEGWNDASQWATAKLVADKRIDITMPGDIVQGIPTGLPCGGDPSANYSPCGELPPLVIDDDVSTKYLNFGGNFDAGEAPSGFQVTPTAGPSIVTGLTFTTANDAEPRDPIAFELYGSNESIDGPYELIASGDIVDFAQADAWPRFTMNVTPIFFENDVPYAHYQVLFTALRDAASANSMQIAEVELLGIPMPPSPVGYWKFDEGSGTTAYDSSGNGLDGTLKGDPQWVEGQVGGALDFDGDDSVEIPDNPLLSITDEITITAWTKMRADASGEMAIVSKGGWAANDLPYELTETAGDVIFWQFYDDGGRDSCSPDSPPVDEWHHIAATYNGEIFKCYIDGELAEEWAYEGTMPENTAPVTIGQRSRGGTFFNGLIDEVAIYDTALSADEISGLVGN